MEELRSILLSNGPSSKQELNKRMVEKSSWHAARYEQAAPIPLGELCLQLGAPCRHPRGWPGPPDPVLSRPHSPPAAALQGPRQAHVLFFIFWLFLFGKVGLPSLRAPPCPQSEGPRGKHPRRSARARGPQAVRVQPAPCGTQGTNTTEHGRPEHCLHDAAYTPLIRKRPHLPASCKNLFK